MSHHHNKHKHEQPNAQAKTPAHMQAAKKCSASVDFGKLIDFNQGIGNVTKEEARVIEANLTKFMNHANESNYGQLTSEKSAIASRVMKAIKAGDFDTAISLNAELSE